MIIKHRFEPVELKILKYLQARMTLSLQDSNHYVNLVKGFEGEQIFDSFLDSLSDNLLILNDLLLEINSTIFQIDSLFISQETIYLFEVKNYEGDFYIEDGNWYTISGKEIKNPVLQLKRSESLLRRLLQDLGYHYHVEAFLVLVNSDFFLYQTPMNLPIIFPTQVNRFLNKINMNSAELTFKPSKFAKKLLSILLKESPYTRQPAYAYGQLEKGISCTFCHSLADHVQGNLLVCKKCGNKEKITSAVLRSIEEYKFLFPKRKITTNAIYEWCKEIKSKKTIHRILKNNFKPKGHGISTYYVDPDNE